MLEHRCDSDLTAMPAVEDGANHRDDSPIEEPQPSPSDDFEGIESVEDVLDIGDAVNLSQSPEEYSAYAQEEQPILPGDGNTISPDDMLPQTPNTDVLLPDGESVMQYEGGYPVPYEDDRFQEPYQAPESSDALPSDARQPKRERRQARKAAKMLSSSSGHDELDRFRWPSPQVPVSRRQVVHRRLEDIDPDSFLDVHELKVRTGDCDSDGPDGAEEAYHEHMHEADEHLVEEAQLEPNSLRMEEDHVPEEVEYDEDEMYHQDQIKSYQRKHKHEGQSNKGGRWQQHLDLTPSPIPPRRFEHRQASYSPVPGHDAAESYSYEHEADDYPDQGEYILRLYRYLKLTPDVRLRWLQCTRSTASYLFARA